jgi:hypothetical protein
MLVQSLFDRWYVLAVNIAALIIVAPARGIRAVTLPRHSLRHRSARLIRCANQTDQ